MKVCLLGGNGYLGPYVVEELEQSSDYELRITDVKPPRRSRHETMKVDVSNLDQVRRAADGCDVIVNCSVLRPHRQIAWDVNTIGTYNAIQTAVDLGHKRFINTGPHFTITDEPYWSFDHDISTDVPPHAGTGLYALSKSAGQEICRLYSQQYPIHVLCMLFLNFRAANPSDGRFGGRGRDLIPFSVTFADAARAIRCSLEAPLRRMPSRNEVFWVTADLPHGKYSNDKTKRLLGWKPQDSLEAYYRRSLQP